MATTCVMHHEGYEASDDAWTGDSSDDKEQNRQLEVAELKMFPWSDREEQQFGMSKSEGH